MPNLATTGLLNQAKNASTCIWPGKSGKSYQYWVYRLPPNFSDDPGNYIFAKIVKGKWAPIYIGETADLSERFEDHHKAVCIRSKEATHIHAHINKNGTKSRQDEEQDILDNFPNAKKPIGCNG